MAETLSTTVIVAIVLGCVLVVIIFAFVLISIFYRKKLKSFLRRNNMSAIYKPSIEDPDQSVSTYENSSAEIRNAFIKACAKKHESNNLLFNEEFKSLPDYTLINTSSVSKRKINRLKNRYSNIDAFDHSRVVLNDKTNSEDYINANFVQGYSNSKKFIATQGPKAETIVDFWRMIYLFKVKAIVMLTNLTENGVLKCHQYWPSILHKTVSYGSNQVTLVEEVICGDYVKRKFDLVTSNTGRGEKASFNTITHYYYQKWYDRGVPDTYPISILKLIRDVNENHPYPEYPIVVHCSAGVGRTGTYITLDAMLECLNTSDNFIDIYDFVSKLRMQRCYLVQTLVQYIFIHDSLSDYCTYGFTDIKKGCVKEAYGNLKKKISGNSDRKSSKETDQLQLEFDKLDLQTPLLTSIQTALSNPELNRDSEVLCFDENRIILRDNGHEIKNYINASNMLNNFIITEDPMENTILNFWKMIIQNKAKLIVSLNKEFIEEYEKVNWPTPENPCIIFDLNETRYEIKLLQNDSSSDSDESDINEEGPMILTRYFKIIDLSSDIQTIELNVTNLIFNQAWWENTRPQKTNIALDLIKKMNYFVELYKDCSILIHGYGGGSNCLMVCALYVLIDQLTYENSVDIFNTVKYLNTQRWNTKLNHDQYDYLYKCLSELP